MPCMLNLRRSRTSRAHVTAWWPPNDVFNITLITAVLVNVVIALASVTSVATIIAMAITMGM
eukprot:5691475-Alexandrium_andersonii.AAC.1